MDHNKILVVDVDAIILDLMKASLDTMGYKVTKASSADMASGALRVQRFDLVVTDLHLGEYNGIGVLQNVKTSNPLTQVVIITGDYSPSSVIKAFHSGADDYLLKPFTMHELNECVRKNLSKFNGAAGKNFHNFETPLEANLFPGPILD